MKRKIYDTYACEGSSETCIGCPYNTVEFADNARFVKEKSEIYKVINSKGLKDTKTKKKGKSGMSDVKECEELKVSLCTAKKSVSKNKKNAKELTVKKTSIFDIEIDADVKEQLKEKPSEVDGIMLEEQGDNKEYTGNFDDEQSSPSSEEKSEENVSLKGTKGRKSKVSSSKSVKFGADGVKTRKRKSSGESADVDTESVGDVSKEKDAVGVSGALKSDTIKVAENNADNMAIPAKSHSTGEVSDEGISVKQLKFLLKNLNRDGKTRDVIFVLLAINTPLAIKDIMCLKKGNFNEKNYIKGCFGDVDDIEIALDSKVYKIIKDYIDTELNEYTDDDYLFKMSRGVESHVSVNSQITRVEQACKVYEGRADKLDFKHVNLSNGNLKQFFWTRCQRYWKVIHMKHEYTPSFIG